MEAGVTAMEPLTEQLMEVMGRVAMETSAPSDLTALESIIDNLETVLVNANGLGSELDAGLVEQCNGDQALQSAATQYHEPLTRAADLITELPNSGGLPRGDVSVGLVAFGQHHTTTSGPSGQFLTYGHTRLDVEDGRRTMQAGSVTIQALHGRLESLPVTHEYEAVEFPSAGSFNFSIDVG